MIIPEQQLETRVSLGGGNAITLVNTKAIDLPLKPGDVVTIQFRVIEVTKSERWER